MGLKIFHTSDVHLGLKFAGYPDEVRAKLIDARFDTLRKLVEMANGEFCDIFAVSGDLFDRLSVAKKDVVKAAQILSEFQGRVVAVLPGNHDFVSAGKGDIWSQFKENKGDNVLVLEKREVCSLKTFDLDVNLYPATCDSKHSKTNYLAWIKETAKDSAVMFHIGLAHGSLEGLSPDPEKNYYPMSVSELMSCGLDLWLMGHTHISYPDKPGPKDIIYYPSTPEPDGFDCDHEGMAWIIEIDDDKKVNAKRLSTGAYRFIHNESVVDGPADIEKIRNSYVSDEYSKSLLKIRLDGRLLRDEIGTLAELREFMKQRFLYIQFDDSGVSEEITLDDINSTFVEHSFPHKLLTMLSDNDDRYALQLAYDLLLEEKQ